METAVVNLIKVSLLMETAQEKRQAGECHPEKEFVFNIKNQIIFRTQKINCPVGV